MRPPKNGIHVIAILESSLAEMEFAGAATNCPIPHNILQINILHKEKLSLDAPASMYFHDCWSNRKSSEKHNNHIIIKLQQHKLSPAAPANFKIAFILNSFSIFQSGTAGNHAQSHPPEALRGNRQTRTARTMTKTTGCS